MNAIWLRALASVNRIYLKLNAPLTNSLPANSIFSRASTATLADFASLVLTAKSGEARFEGARRVQNLLTVSSEDLTVAGWTKSGLTPTLDGTVTIDGVVLTLTRLTLTGGLALHYAAPNAFVSNTALSGAYIDASGMTTKRVVLSFSGGSPIVNAIVSVDWSSPTSLNVGSLTLGTTWGYRVIGNYQAIIWHRGLDTNNFTGFALFAGLYGNYSGDGEYIKVSRIMIEEVGNAANQLVPTSELVVNKTFDSDVSNWTVGTAPATVTWNAGGYAKFDRAGNADGNVSTSAIPGGQTVVADKVYQVEWEVKANSGGTHTMGWSIGNGTSSSLINYSAGRYRVSITAGATTSQGLRLLLSGSVSAWYELDNISCREITLIPSEYVSVGTQRRNLLNYTEELDNAAWTKSGCTISANSTTAPDGAKTADKVVINAGVTAFISQILLSLPTLTTYTQSIYLKKADYNYVFVWFDRGDGNGYTIEINLLTGANRATRSFSAGYFTNFSYNVTYTNGFYRVEMTATTAISTQIQLRVYSSSVAWTTGLYGTEDEIGDGTKGTYIWCAQLEKNSVATSYQRIYNGVPLDNLFHGVNVDGVKQFPYENGNTITGNVVTEAIGSAIPKDTMLGYLSESSRTNIVLQNNALNNVAWGKNNVTITPNSAIAPDGSLSADTITDNFNGDDRIFQNLTFTYQNKTRTFSVYVKKTSGDTHYKALNNNQVPSYSGSKVVVFNTNTGVITAETTAGVGTITSEGDYWRVSVKKADVNNADTLHNLQFYPAWNTTGVLSQNTATTGSAIAWGFQYEDGDTPTSLIPTTTATVTRSADVLNYEFGAGLFPQQFTLFISVKPSASGASYANSNIRLFGTDDATGAADEVRTIGGAAYSFSVTGGGVEIVLNKSDFSAGVSGKWGFSLKQEGDNIRCAVVLNGVTKLNAVAAGVLAHSDTGILQIGRYDSDYLNGTLKDLRVFTGAMDFSKLKTLTL